MQKQQQSAMKNLSFVWQGKGSLLGALTRPFDRLSIWLDVIQRPQAVRLFYRDSASMLIRSNVHTVAYRTELGVLEFSIDETPFDNELNVEMVRSWGPTVAIEKLVIETHGTRAESGVAFKNARSEEIVIVSGAQPFGLAINVPWNTTLPKFSPEYSLEEYRRVRMID